MDIVNGYLKNYRYITLLLAVLATALSSVLWRHHELNASKHVPKKSVGYSSLPTPGQGTSILALRGHDALNHDVTVDLSHGEGQTLLLVLSPVCSYCRVNFHNWRDLVKMLPSDDVVWVDLTGTADTVYMGSVGIPTSARFISLAQDGSEPSGFTSTPTTVLLDSNGKVIWSWAGLMNQEQVDQLKSVLTSGHRARL